ncbi:hypothetical protein FQA39_LY11783 [Lamprigera yunnana]|nr:hypothetical protein FQA39_LY11783 [Lamprigera yunnana]
MSSRGKQILNLALTEKDLQEPSLTQKIAATVNKDNNQIVLIPDYELSMVLNSALDNVNSIPNKHIDDSDITAHVIVSGCMRINKTECEQSTMDYTKGDTTISNIDVTEYITEREEDNENVEEATDSINIDGDVGNSVTYHRIQNGEHADENRYSENIFDKGTEADYIESSEGRNKKTVLEKQKRIFEKKMDSIPTSCIQLAKEQIIKYRNPKYNINDLKTRDCETMLLNQTIYYLNNSKSKWMSVGLYYPFEFASVVKIFGRSKQYVIFKEEEWIQFHEQRENINKYFQTFDTMWKPSQIGSKTLTFEMIEEKKILKIEDMSGNEVYLG